MIPTKNRATDLSRCIEALHPQLREGDELIVVDNGSTDRTATLLASWPSIQVVRDPTRNLAHLFNAGTCLASNELVGFLNDDAVPDEKWIQQYSSWFSHLSDAVAIGGPVRDVKQRILASTLSRSRLLYRLYDLFVARGHVTDYFSLNRVGGYSLGMTPPSSPVKVSGLSITNLVIRKSALKIVGFFDEDLWFSHIDGLLFARMGLLKLPMYAVPDCGVTHLVNPTGSTRSAYFLSRDQAVFTRKLRQLGQAGIIDVGLMAAGLVLFWFLAVGDNRLARGVNGIRGLSSGLLAPLNSASLSAGHG